MSATKSQKQVRALRNQRNQSGVAQFKALGLKTHKDLVMEAWDRLYGPEERAERRKALWAKEEVNRKARSKL